jgi:protein involved in polysaccharide export with SLBB domain
VWLALYLALVAAGCARRTPDVAPLPVIVESGPYRVQPGDMVDVKFLYHAAENQRLPVRADGILALTITGDLEVAGLTVEEIEDLVRDRASRFLRDPVVAVTVAETGARAYVGGEVTNAGFVSLVKPMTALQAILERGGVTPGADLEHVTIISKATGTPVSREVDLRADAEGGPAAFLLTPDDVVFVRKTGIASANAWVNSWIDGLTPQVLKSLRFPTF